MLQTLVIKVAGVILSVVGGLAVGKVREHGVARGRGSRSSCGLSAALCLPGRTDDSLRLRDCCWDFPGQVDVPEAGFQGEPAPPAPGGSVGDEGDHKGPWGSGALMLQAGMLCWGPSFCRSTCRKRLTRKEVRNDVCELKMINFQDTLQRYFVSFPQNIASDLMCVALGLCVNFRGN